MHTALRSAALRLFAAPRGPLAAGVRRAAMSSGGAGSALNLRVRGLERSATLVANERVLKMRSEGKPFYNFGLGQSPFPVPDGLVNDLRDAASEKDYLPVQGLPDLRRAVAETYSARDDRNVSAEDVLIGPGSKELLFLLQMAYNGELLLPAPSWVSYGPQSVLLGRPMQYLRTYAEDRWRLLPARLDIHCQKDPNHPRILILNYPSNPTGMCYSADELEALAMVARKHKIIVLADEIYGAPNVGEGASIASFYPEGTIVLTGLSKVYGAGGWRLGAFVFPHELKPILDAMCVIASETYTSVAAPIQYAAIRAFSNDADIAKYVANTRNILDAVSTVCFDKLVAAGTQVTKPDGAFYIFPDLGEHRETLHARWRDAHSVAEWMATQECWDGLTSRQVLEQILDDTGVVALAGSEFGRPHHELSCRMSYVDFDGGAALGAVDTLGAVGGDPAARAAWVGKHAPRVVQGMDALSAYLHG